MQHATDNIPELKTLSGGEGEFRILVIGWNREAIFDVTERISADQASLREELSRSWQERLREHYSLIKATPVLSRPRKFAIESAQGTYAIECRKVMGTYYGSDPNESSLRITYSRNDGWIGIFEIGIIYNVMRLDTERKGLLARCKATEKNESRVDDHTGMHIPLEESESIEGEDDASEEEDVCGDLSADETEDVDGSESSSFEIVTRRKRRRAPTKASNPAKRSKPSSTRPSNRLYLKWRGREKGEGGVAYDFYRKNTGYLQSTDSNCTKFESTISNDFTGKNMRFQGFKVSADGSADTRTYHE